jgi:hypothetical protein
MIELDKLLDYDCVEEISIAFCTFFLAVESKKINVFTAIQVKELLRIFTYIYFNFQYAHGGLDSGKSFIPVCE